MINRTRDIINLREAARRCRSNAENTQGPRADGYLRLAEEIDGKIATLIAESAAGRADEAPRIRPLPRVDVAGSGGLSQAIVR